MNKKDIIEIIDSSNLEFPTEQYLNLKYLAKKDLNFKNLIIEIREENKRMKQFEISTKRIEGDDINFKLIKILKEILNNQRK